MRKALGVILLLAFGLSVYAEDDQKPTKPPVIKPLTPEHAKTYEGAQQNLAQRERELQQSAVYQAYLAAQASERAAFFFIKSELGAGKDCQPTFDADKKLTGFSCEAK